MDIYSKFFQYKIPDGFFIYSYNDKQEIDIFIEIGDTMIVNFLGKFISIKSNKNIKLIMSLICYGFRINKIALYPDYIPVSDIVKNRKDILFTSRIYINSILYNLIYDKKLDYSVYNNDKIRDFLNSSIKKKNINYNLQKYLPIKSYGELIKTIFAKNAFDIKYMNLSLPNNIINSHYEIFPYNYLLNNNIIYVIPNIYSKYINRRALKSPEFYSIDTNNFRNIVS